jgi:hypothetical protein
MALKDSFDSGQRPIFVFGIAHTLTEGCRMNVKALSLVALGALLDVLSDGLACAQTIPSYSWDGSQICAGQCLSFPENTSVTYTVAPGVQPIGSGSASASDALALSPSLSAAATAGGLVSASAVIKFTYYIELSGLGGTTVPLTINTEGSADADSQASVAIYTASLKEIYAADAGQGKTYVFDGNQFLIPAGTPGNSFNRSDTIELTEGLIYSVVMELQLGAFNSSTMASVDPYFSNIPSGYALDISAGVGNSPLSSTPIPATLPLFVGGLCAIGLLSWRRKLKTPADIETI